MRENDFLSWIRENTPEHPRVPLGIGDDMAWVMLASGAGALLKIDQCLDGVHFDLRRHTAAEAGRKAVNRCLSDCAGMACVPVAITISVALPREGAGSGEDFARALFLACRDAAARFDCPLVGGDTGLWGDSEGRLAITVAALGEVPAGQHEVRRSGARAGDTLFVSGALGGSILGRHLTFEPRIALAQQLAKALGTEPAGAGGNGGALHAMMDLSDGLGQDLPRLCTASGVGARVYAGKLPIHADAHRLVAEQASPLPAGLHALADGEDYELLFAVETEAIPELIPVSERGGIPLTAIGTVTEEKGLVLVDEAGREHPWPRLGWEHRS